MEKNRIDNYILLEKVSKSMSLLYKAKDEHLDKIVALKVLPEEYKENSLLINLFEKEFRNLAQLDHPNITRIYHAGKFKNRWYFVMEWVDGMDLKRYLLKYGILDIKKTLHILKQISHALQYAHKLKIIHRDIKSSNILIKPANEGVKAYLTDFGISKDISRTAGTVATGVIGTADYIPPEQALGRKDLISPASDVYSLGIVCYEMLTGRVPFKAEADTAVIQMHLNTPPPSPRQFNPMIQRPVEKVILRAMEKQPDRRFQSAWEFYLTLVRAVEATSTRIEPAKAAKAKSTPLPFPASDYTWIYPVAGVLGLSLGILMYFAGKAMNGTFPF